MLVKRTPAQGSLLRRGRDELAFLPLGQRCLGNEGALRLRNTTGKMSSFSSSLSFSLSTQLDAKKVDDKLHPVSLPLPPHPRRAEIPAPTSTSAFVVPDRPSPPLRGDDKVSRRRGLVFFSMLRRRVFFFFSLFGAMARRGTAHVRALFLRACAFCTLNWHARAKTML